MWLVKDVEKREKNGMCTKAIHSALNIYNEEKLNSESKSTKKIEHFTSKQNLQ
jgi:hypothetical protein